MAIIFYFNGSRRLGRKRNLYQGRGQQGKNKGYNSKSNLTWQHCRLERCLCLSQVWLIFFLISCVSWYSINFFAIYAPLFFLYTSPLPSFFFIWKSNSWSLSQPFFPRVILQQKNHDPNLRVNSNKALGHQMQVHHKSWSPVWKVNCC